MDQVIEQLLNSDTHWLLQFVKYSLCGGLATLTDMLVFYSLSWKLIPALKSDDLLLRLLRKEATPADERRRGRNFIINTAIAFIFSNLVAYISNMLWVFEPGRHAWYVEVGLFYSVSLISVGIGTYLGWAMIHYWKLSTTSSYIGKLIAALLVNFVCRKFIIFRG
jgi:putative flippase GtrA